MEREHSRKHNSVLWGLCESYNDTLREIRVNISIYDRRLDVRDWIQEAHYYAERILNEAISIINSGGTITIYRDDKIVKTHAGINDIYENYYKRTETVQYYADRLRALQGPATPIPLGGLGAHEG